MNTSPQEEVPLVNPEIQNTAAFEQEKDQVAQKYGVMDKSKLSKKGDQWYFDVLPIEEWAGLLDEKDNMYKNKN